MATLTARVFAALALSAVAGLAMFAWRAGVAPLPGGAPTDGAAAPRDALALELDDLLQRTALPAGPSLGLRPFEVDGADPALPAMARALCRELVSQLTRLGGLRVLACESAEAAPARHLGDRQLGLLLAADHLLHGRLEDSPGQGTRMKLALRRAGDGSVRWQFDAELREPDRYELPRQVAERIAAVFGLRPPASARPKPPAIVSRLERARRLAQTDVTGQRAALRIVDEVLAASPDDLAARLMQVSLRDQLLALQELPPDARRQARRSLMADIQRLGEELLSRDPNDVRGRTLLAGIAAQQFRWREAFALIDQPPLGVTADPGALLVAARLNAVAGYLARARALALSAAQADPLNAYSHDMLALTYWLLGDDARLAAHARIAVDLGRRVSQQYLAAVALRRGDWHGAQATLSETLRGSGQDGGWIGPFVAAVADPGRRAETAARLAKLPPPQQAVMDRFFIHFGWLGDTERALAAMQANLAAPLGLWLADAWAPEMAHLRRAAGFVPALRSVGLPALWAARGAPDRCQASGSDWRCD